MWDLKPPKPVKLIVGILAADSRCLVAAVDALSAKLGGIDMASDVWPFEKTDYYKDQTGENILRQFVTIERLICPGKIRIRWYLCQDIRALPLCAESNSRQRR